MANGYNVAVAGATGAVGVEMVKTLEKRNFPVKNLKLLASARSAGKTMKFRGEDVVIEEMTHDSFKGIDIALFSAGGDISREYRPFVVESGAVMIDNSSAFRMPADTSTPCRDSQIRNPGRTVFQADSFEGPDKLTGYSLLWPSGTIGDFAASKGYLFARHTGTANVLWADMKSSRISTTICNIPIPTCSNGGMRGRTPTPAEPR